MYLIERCWTLNRMKKFGFDFGLVPSVNYIFYVWGEKVYMYTWWPKKWTVVETKSGQPKSHAFKKYIYIFLLLGRVCPPREYISQPSLHKLGRETSSLWQNMSKSERCQWQVEVTKQVWLLHSLFSHLSPGEKDSAENPRYKRRQN